MIEVFKTNITNQETADVITAGLQRLFPHSIVDFDLEDCDKILRIKGEGISLSGVIAHLECLGFTCEELQ
jgi:hypothetical protein